MILKMTRETLNIDSIIKCTEKKFIRKRDVVFLRNQMIKDLVYQKKMIKDLEMARRLTER